MAPLPNPLSLADSPTALLPSSTPAGLDTLAELARRRLLVILLNVATWLALNTAAAHVLASGGWSLVDTLAMLAFMVGTPWTVLGFWNAVIGLWLLHGTRHGLAEVAPYAAAGASEEPIRVRTAVLMTLRNEDPARSLARLAVVEASIAATGHGGCFDYFVLSDSDDARLVGEEEAAVSALRARMVDPTRLTYRRRAENTGYKAGNIRDFCQRHGAGYELMLPLDADSLMSGRTIVALVRMMQAHPKLGILQSLVVGMPSKSAFARIFQFGMRQGMRAYTMGQAWWTADCGPFWGHNALVRVAPFRDHCDLPVLPGGPPLGGHVLSHDQVEATLMRRAGYEVRVLPQEVESYEENPPTLMEFSRRDLRWCLGNLQYLRLLDLPGLKPMSRFQLIWAIMMFIGIPAWTLMLALLPCEVVDAAERADFPSDWALGVYLVFLAMYLMPKLTGLADVVLTQGGVKRYGGAARFAASALIELAFSFLLGAVTAFRITLFMIGLALRRKGVAWAGQARDAHGLSWRSSARALWPNTLFGLVVLIPTATLSLETALWSLPLTLGFLTSIPFAVATANPRLGAWCARVGLAGIPEDFATPPVLAALRARG